LCVRVGASQGNAVPQDAAPRAVKPPLGVAELVGYVAALIALNALAIDFMLPALESIGADLGVGDPNDPQLVILVYVFASGIAQLVYGPLADRFGRRPVLLAALGAYVIAAALSVVATSFALLLASRVMQGLSTAAGRVVGVAIVRDMSSGRRMAEIMSMAITVFMIVPVIAPGIGQLALLVTPWRGLFAALTAYGLAVLIWTWVRLPETLPPDRRRSLEPLSIARAFLEAARHRTALGYTLASMFMFSAPMAYLSSADQVFGRTFELGALFPLAFGAVALSLAAASIVNARLVGRFGMRRISHLAASMFAAVSVLHLGLAAAGAETLTSFLVLQTMSFFALGLMMGNFTSLALEPLGHIAGVASSALGFATLTGGALIGGAIARAYDGTTLPLLAGFAATSLATLGCVLAAERGRLFRSGSDSGAGIG
jgi:DHA1 family bicyclomycin/chloramphenicol resistance-like MFS transporter